jgi:hypothetical protein
MGSEESNETEQAAAEEYIEGHDAYERAADTWDNAVQFYDNEEWSQASQSMEEASNQYDTATGHFIDAGNMGIPDQAAEFAREASDYTVAMTNSARNYADAAAAFGSGNSQNANESQDQGEEDYEEAQNVGPPPRINAFRDALELD